MAFDPATTALVSLDLQVGVVSVYVKDEHFIPRVARLLGSARRAGLLVVHVKVGYRPGVPEASPHNRFLQTVKGSPQHQAFFQGASGAIHPTLEPGPSDLVVTKSRVSAFAGTDLDLLLRAHGISTVILLGVATSGVVLATFSDAFDRDYEVVVIKDCCADLEPDLHQAFVDRHFPRFGTVMSANDCQQLLDGKRD